MLQLPRALKRSLVRRSRGFVPERLIRALGVLHEFGCVSHAARRLHVSQHALVERISELESLVGGRLVKSERGVSALTRAGLRLLGSPKRR